MAKVSRKAGRLKATEPDVRSSTKHIGDASQVSLPCSGQSPEAGVRYWLKKDVALVGRAEVPFDLEGWKYKDSVRYFLGISVKF